MLLFLLAPSTFWGYLALGLGAALAGGVGGAIVGLGQALALRRWLDGAASLGSFLSTVLASSAALASGTTAGWWAYTSAGGLVVAFSGVVIYGCAFGLLQRPMLDYMTRRSILWIPANALAAVPGAATMLAAFDVSGGRREMLQFRLADILYSLVAGAAFLWMTREARNATAAARTGKKVPRNQPEVAAGLAHIPRHAAASDPALLEIHEHRVYRVYQASQHSDPDQDGNTHAPRARSDRDDSGSEGGESGPGVIDATYRVVS